jgi:hypothetical protein
MTLFRAQQKLSDEYSRAVARDARFLGRGADVVRSHYSPSYLYLYGQMVTLFWEEKYSLDRK